VIIASGPEIITARSRRSPIAGLSYQLPSLEVMVEAMFGELEPSRKLRSRHRTVLVEGALPVRRRDRFRAGRLSA
jgi:hypothetical protein